jgi:small-conductance mechanosensitive channel
MVDHIALGANLSDRFGVALGLAEAQLLRLFAALPLLLIAILIVLLARWLGRVLSRRTHWLRLRSPNPYMEGLVRRVVQFLVLLAGILVALDLLGATALVGAVLGSAGVVGLVLGFAFRDIAENYIAGVLLSLRQPFTPGDHVVIEGREGKVAALNARTTILITLDGSELRLPNALVFKSVILNYSRNPKRRFEFTIPIDQAESIRAAQQLALAEIASIDGVLAEPAPAALVHEYGAKGITLRYFGWVDQHQSDLNKVRSEAIRRVKGAFGKAGIEPPRDVYHLVNELRGDATGKHEPALAADIDTSVNRDIDPQLATAKRAGGDRNLLDGTPHGNE